MLLRDAQTLGETILQAAIDPLIVLDRDLRVKLANSAFYRAFGLTSAAVLERSLAEIEDGAWNSSALRGLLESVLDPEGPAESASTVSVAGAGNGTLRLSARRLRSGTDAPPLVLLSFQGLGSESGSPSRT